MIIMVLVPHVILAEEKPKLFSVKSVSVDLSGFTIINTNDRSGFRSYFNNPISPWMSNNNISIDVESENNFRIGINYFSFVGDYLWLNQTGLTIENKKSYNNFSTNKVVSRFFDRAMINFGKSFANNDHSLFLGLNLSRLFNGYERIIYEKKIDFFQPGNEHIGHSNYKGNGIGFSLEYRYTFFNKMYIGVSNHFTYSKFQAEYFTYGDIPRITPTENYNLSSINNTTHISLGYRFGK
jgi:hypothetical protein